jgi:hypothetical protein
MARTLTWIQKHRPWPLAVGFALAAGFAADGAGQKFYPDDPIAAIVDSQDAAGVQEREIDLIYDTLENSFSWPGDRTPNVRAQNVNTVDEVPDSNWFTNRLGARAMTVEELLKGSDTGTGPVAGTWTVVAAKNDGITPGFTVRDAAGQIWFIKVDPPGYRAMATGTEVVVTKLFWALGFYVPEVHLATLRPDELAIDEGARITPPNGDPRRFERSDVQVLLRASAPRSGRLVSCHRQQGRSRGGRSAAFASTALARTIPTTSSRTSIAASCARTARSRPG